MEAPPPADPHLAHLSQACPALAASWSSEPLWLRRRRSSPEPRPDPPPSAPRPGNSHSGPGVASSPGQQGEDAQVTSQSIQPRSCSSPELDHSRIRTGSQPDQYFHYEHGDVTLQYTERTVHVCPDTSFSCFTIKAAEGKLNSHTHTLTSSM